MTYLLHPLIYRIRRQHAQQTLYPYVILSSIAKMKFAMQFPKRSKTTTNATVLIRVLVFFIDPADETPRSTCKSKDARTAKALEHVQTVTFVKIRTDALAAISQTIERNVRSKTKNK